MAISPMLQRFRIYTDQNRIYDELTENKKIFSLKRELFTAALVIGVVNNRKSQKTPRGTNILDFYNLPTPYQGLISLLFDIICEKKDKRACLDELLKYADGGLELIWDDYQAQGTLDLLRLVEETKEKWPQRMEELKIKKPKTEIEELIGEGENDKVEFKTSMCWDYTAKRQNKKVLGEVVARAVASFMNTNGGQLLIGVKDNKQILGLKKDLAVFNKHTTDQFELHFTNIIRDYLGIENRAHVQIRFETVERKTIAVIEVPKKSPKPVFFKTGGDEPFWVRMGNSTQRLPNSKVPEYIKQHWPELNK